MCTTHPWVVGFQVCSNEGPFSSPNFNHPLSCEIWDLTHPTPQLKSNKMYMGQYAHMKTFPSKKQAWAKLKFFKKVCSNVIYYLPCKRMWPSIWTMLPESWNLHSCSSLLYSVCLIFSQEYRRICVCFFI